ncbi:MAG: hypothetical protein K0R18_1070 [Bacillales bacterium]|jgi:hypothetical protein|nr:hypothetical protein [Bacillales bacterium]
MKISQIGKYQVNPFLEMEVTDQNIYRIKNSFGEKIIFQWRWKKEEPSVDEKYSFFNLAGKYTGYKILINNSLHCDFLVNLRDVIKETTIRNLSKSELSRTILQKLSYGYVDYYSITNKANSKQIWCGNIDTKATESIAVVEYHGLDLNSERIFNLMGKYNCIIFLSRMQHSCTIGPFLEKRHLVKKNLNLLSHDLLYIAKFNDQQIIKKGLDKFVDYNIYLSIIEYLSNYLIQVTPLYNRRMTVTFDGEVKLGACLPLY